MQSLSDVQIWAKRAFPGDKIKLQSYRIGKDEFGDNRTGLEQDAVVIIDLAEADALPGLTPTKLADARAQLAAWKSADEAQQTAEKTQADLLTQLRSQVSAINTARREIQFAADTLWPHTNPNNAPTRKLFKLHAKRPMQ